MKWTFVVISILTPLSVWASDCRVIEYPDRNEVVCEGTPGEYKPDARLEVKGRDGLTKSQRESLVDQVNENIVRLQNKISGAEREITERKNKPSLENDIKVSSVNAMEIERSSNYVTYSIKADIDNKGNPGVVFIKLVGKNRDGHQVDSVYLTGKFNRNESKTMTTTSMLSLQHSMDVREWVVDSVNKY